jgi:hypothetical protein
VVKVKKEGDVEKVSRKVKIANKIEKKMLKESAESSDDSTLLAQKVEIEKSIKKDMSTKIGRPVGTVI